LGLGHNENVLKQVEKIPLELNGVKFIVCGPYTSFIVDSENRLYVAGYNSKGELGLGNVEDQNTFVPVNSLPSGAIDLISCGHYHTFIVISMCDTCIS
jgi:alpha-tubulin suppressor-like RCC1 family protein